MSEELRDGTLFVTGELSDPYKGIAQTSEPTALTFELLKSGQISNDHICETLLTNPDIDFDHRKKPSRESFVGTIEFNEVRGKVDVDFLYCFHDLSWWMYSWEDHDWVKSSEPTYFNFQVPFYPSRKTMERLSRR